MELILSLINIHWTEATQLDIGLPFSLWGPTLDVRLFSEVNACTEKITYL